MVFLLWIAYVLFFRDAERPPLLALCGTWCVHVCVAGTEPRGLARGLAQLPLAAPGWTPWDDCPHPFPASLSSFFPVAIPNAGRQHHHVTNCLFWLFSFSCLQSWSPGPRGKPGLASPYLPTITWVYLCARPSRCASGVQFSGDGVAVTWGWKAVVLLHALLSGIQGFGFFLLIS